MHLPTRRTPLIVPFALLLAIVTLGAPAISALHALEHAAPIAVSTGGEPAEEPESEELCDFCLSLSQARSALAPAGLVPHAHTSLAVPLGSRETLVLPARVALAHAPPRAPPLG